MKLPKKISPCPIEEAIIEVRFEPSSPEDAVFGIIYSYLKEKYSRVESLSILDLPEKIRKGDQNLRYKPYHRLAYQNYILQIGPRVLSVAVKKEYPGWENFYNHIKWVLQQVKKAEIISSIERNSLRYINLFDIDIFENIDLNVTLNNKRFNTSKTYFQTQISKHESRIVLQISNNILSENEKNKSIIDVDVIADNPKQDFISNNKVILDKLHTQEKEIFFPLLTKEFLENLNPTY